MVQIAGKTINLASKPETSAVLSSPPPFDLKDCHPKL